MNKKNLMDIYEQNTPQPPGCLWHPAVMY